VIATDIGRRLIRAGAQTADQPCEFEESFVDVVLPLDQHAMTQCRLAVLADTLAENSSACMLAAMAALVTASARSAARSIVNRVVVGLFISEDSLAVCFSKWSRAAMGGASFIVGENVQGL
jgi:hypothetical protein